MSDSRFRILHVNSMLQGGGTDDQSVSLAVGLAQLGQDVWLAGPEDRQMSARARVLGGRFVATPPQGLLSLRFIRACARIMRRERIEIVHGHHGRDIWPTILAAKLSGMRPKIVLTRHMAKSPASWPSRYLLLSQCDALIAVSDFVAKVLREGADGPAFAASQRHVRGPIYGDHSKIHVAYGGIDTGRFRPAEALTQRREWGLVPEHFAFAVVGDYNLDHGKGQRVFLRAAAQIHVRVPMARFLIVGRGNMAALLERDIRDLGLSGKAWLTPYSDDMPAGMNALDCLVHPSVGTEAFGMVICEAHACGKPVIASALDGIPEALADGYGQLVQPENVDELAAAMEAWATRPPMTAAERCELHRKTTEQFSTAAAARRVLGIYESLAPANAAPIG